MIPWMWTVRVRSAGGCARSVRPGVSRCAWWPGWVSEEDWALAGVVMAREVLSAPVGTGSIPRWGVEGLWWNPPGLPSSIANSTVPSMTEQQYKVRENRLRRMADRQGLALRKSPRRDPRALGYGTYMLVEPTSPKSYNMVVSGGLPDGYGLDLDEIERALTERHGGSSPAAGLSSSRTA